MVNSMENLYKPKQSTYDALSDADSVQGLWYSQDITNPMQNPCAPIFRFPESTSTLNEAGTTPSRRTPFTRTASTKEVRPARGASKKHT